MRPAARRARRSELCWGPLRWLAGGWYGITSGAGVAARALLANKFRASMTALGIVIGVMTVTGILAIIHGLDRGVERQMALMGVRSIYVSKWPFVVRGDWYRYINRPPITDWQYRRLRKLVPFADALAPVERERAKVERGDEQITDVEVWGTNHEYLQITGHAIERGRFLSAADVEFERPYVVVGPDVSKHLFGREEPLGGHVLIRGSRYRIIGILKAEGSFLGRSRDVTAIIPVGRFRRDFGSRHSMDIGVRIAPGMDLDLAASELEGIMRRVRGLRPAEEDDFTVNQQKVLGELYGDITGTLYLVIVTVSLISLLVGGIGIMNIMLVSVIERTREIGLRKALGARRRTVLFQFLIESLVLSGIGGLIGLAAGFLVAHVVDSISPLPAALSAQAVIAGLVFSAVVGVSFGIWPAWKASRLDPIDALGHE
ncbi:MAG: ABC transporter permease [Deltaproteobacteria bacterium]|nr:ABC transporter permease [Deltaproteobacteria bacterium]